MWWTAAAGAPAWAEPINCDPCAANCRSTLLTFIRNERVGIDIGQWFTRDSYVVAELIKKRNEGVLIRFLGDLRAEGGHPGVNSYIQRLADAGVAIRVKPSGGIQHAKFFIFAGQHVAQFGSPNLTPPDWLFTEPYKNCRTENIEFYDDADAVNGLKTWFENYWTSTYFRDYANITPDLRTRRYPVFPKGTEWVLPPSEDFCRRIVTAADGEAVAIDSSNLRFEHSGITSALIRAHRRGVRVRILTDTVEYRDPKRPNLSFNVDQLHAAGVPIRTRANIGQNHEKATIFYGQGIVAAGSSNFVGGSCYAGSIEVNLITRNVPRRLSAYQAKNNRRWNNSGYVNGVRVIETSPFVPLGPGSTTYVSPVNQYQGMPQNAAGVPALAFRVRWAHYVDVYLDTQPNPTVLLKRQMRVSPNTTVTVPLPTLTPGTTYYWRVIAKTAANLTHVGPVYWFRVP